MKKREPRRKIFVAAQMRCDGKWRDVHVLDLSSHGCLLQSVAVPERGSYIEISRGPQRLVARVIWTRQEKFGVRTQDCVAVEAFVGATATTRASVQPTGEACVGADQHSPYRRAEANGQRHERSRRLSRATEFGSIVVVGAIAAMMLFTLMQHALSRPIAAVSTALSLQ